MPGVTEVWTVYLDGDKARAVEDALISCGYSGDSDGLQAFLIAWAETGETTKGEPPKIGPALQRLLADAAPKAFDIAANAFAKRFAR